MKIAIRLKSNGAAAQMTEQTSRAVHGDHDQRRADCLMKGQPDQHDQRRDDQKAAAHAQNPGQQPDQHPAADDLPERQGEFCREPLPLACLAENQQRADHQHQDSESDQQQAGRKMLRETRRQIRNDHARPAKKQGNAPVERSLRAMKNCPQRAVHAHNHQRGRHGDLRRLPDQIDQRRDRQDRATAAQQAQRPADPEAQH